MSNEVEERKETWFFFYAEIAEKKKIAEGRENQPLVCLLSQ